MPFSRKNVWLLGGDFTDPSILWYARGVAAMKARALAEPTSWRFYGAIHGFNASLWSSLGYFSKSDKLPSTALQKQFWKQCQHGSWFFLPWHRGYLLGFEANVRDEITKLGGPADWALPYWNYFKDAESALPPAFASADWPDGKGNNPLFVAQRYGPNGDGKVFVPLDEVNLSAMSDPDFSGVSGGGSPGFGGVDTGFSHGGPTHGGLESQPHDMVHVYVGGSHKNNQNQPGLMSVPDTAGLDPIFWLHHANIDRLWEVWRMNPTSDIDPTDANWLNGPASLGERAFVMPMPDGSTWAYKPSDMSVIASLNYSYDDLSPAVAAAPSAARLQMLGFSVPAVAQAEEVPVKTGKNVELVGATNGAVPLQGTEVSATVSLDQMVRKKVAASLSPGSDSISPDRVFLNLENVRGTNDATAFHVYVGLADGDKPGEHSESLAGSVGLFGVSKASDPDEEHGGQGLNFVIEITKIVDRLHLANSLDVDAITVRLVPTRVVDGAEKITIGRISIYRQGH